MIRLAKRGKEPNFRKWLQLESLKEKIIKAVRDGADFPTSLFHYLDTALPINHKFYWKADWIKIVELFYALLSNSPKIELPITAPAEQKDKEEPWNYDGRLWHMYSHLIAKSYGWTLETISQLRPVDALAKIQEILTDEQLDREFYYGLSEVAYAYDKGSKKSRYVPMPRPHWMRPAIKPIEKILIPASMLPMGNVIMDGIPDELKPKQVIH